MKGKRSVMVERFEEQGARVLFFGVDERSLEQVSFHLSRKQARDLMKAVTDGAIVKVQIAEKKGP
jgi:hypothetical protein